MRNPFRQSRPRAGAVVSAALPVFLFLLTPLPARAFGDLGHRVICEAAFRLVSPATREGIMHLLAKDPRYTTFSDACTDPDNPLMRAREHIIELPRDGTGLADNRCPLAPTCLTFAITLDSGRLSSKRASDKDRLLSLKNLGHWIGDAHQPLHVAFRDDHGGEDLAVTGVCREARNFHDVWDTCLVRDAVGIDVARAANALIAAMPATTSEWTSGLPRDWINETFAVTRAPGTGYCVMNGANCDRPAKLPIRIDEAFVKRNAAVVKIQLAKAAARLAALLDRDFGDKPQP